LVLGAAAERDIPLPAPRPDRADRDFGDEDDPVGSGAGDEQDDGDDEARYEPQAPSRRRFLRPLIGALVLLVLVIGGASAGYAWTRTQYFVGAAGEQVAIFQGIPDPVPGLTLSTVYEVQQLAVAALPAAYQDQVRANIEVADLDSARQTVARLSEAAGRNSPEPPPASKSPTPPASSRPPA